MSVITITPGEHTSIDKATVIADALIAKGLVKEYRPVIELGDSIEVIPVDGADRTEIMQVFIDAKFNVLEKD